MLNTFSKRNIHFHKIIFHINDAVFPIWSHFILSVFDYALSALKNVRYIVIVFMLYCEHFSAIEVEYTVKVRTGLVGWLGLRVD